MISGATNFTAASRHDILHSVNFPDFIYSCNMSYKINKTTKVMGLKILPELRNGLNMLQKILSSINYSVNYKLMH